MQRTPRRHGHRRQRSRSNTNARLEVQLRGSNWVVCFRVPGGRFTLCRSIGVALVEDAKRYGSDLLEELVEELMRTAEIFVPATQRSDGSPYKKEHAVDWADSVK